MKKFSVLLWLAVVLLASCSTNQGQFETTHFPVQKEEGGLWGFVDSKGMVVIEGEFKNQPSPVVDGMFLVKTSERTGQLSAFSVDNPNNPVAEGMKDIALFTDGLAPCVRDNEGIKYIDKKGNVKFELPLEYIYAKRFVNGYSLIARKEKGNYTWDAINTKGEITKLPEYSLLVPLKGGVFLADKGNSYHYCIVDKNGNLKAELQGINNQFFNNFSYKNCSNADIDRMRVEFNYDTRRAIGPDCKNYIFMDSLGEGVKSLDGKVLCRAKDDEDLFFLDNGKIEMKNRDEEFGIEDVKGNVYVRPKYKVIESFGYNKYIVAKASNDGWKYGLINQKEDHVLEFDYDGLEAISESALLALVHSYDFMDGTIYKYQIISPKGKVLGEYAAVVSNALDCERYYNCVKSDYFDVAACVKSLLCPEGGLEGETIDNLYGFARWIPYECATVLDMELTKDDIINDVWFPEAKRYDSDFGTVSYNLGFSKGASEVYYEEYDTYGLYPRYSFSANECDYIRVILNMNNETRSHKDQIEKQLEKVLSEFGYSKVGESDYGDPYYSNSVITLQTFLDSNSLVIKAYTN